MTTGDFSLALVTAVVVLGLVAWFDARCLADLRSTGDRELRLFDRRTWTLIIVLSFPFRPDAVSVLCERAAPIHLKRFLDAGQPARSAAALWMNAVS